MGLSYLLQIGFWMKISPYVFFNPPPMEEKKQKVFQGQEQEGGEETLRIFLNEGH